MSLTQNYTGSKKTVDTRFLSQCSTLFHKSTCFHFRFQIVRSILKEKSFEVSEEPNLTKSEVDVEGLLEECQVKLEFDRAT